MSFTTLLFQSLAMGISSFLVGLIPMLLGSSNGKKLKFLSVYGMGLLVGAALSIVIPEGVSKMYEATSLASASKEKLDGSETTEDHSPVIGMSLLGGFILMMIVEKFSHSLTSRSSNHSHALASQPPNIRQTSTTPLISSPSRPPTWQRLSNRASNHDLQSNQQPEGDQSDEEADEAMMSQVGTPPRRSINNTSLGGSSLGGSGSSGNEKSGLLRLVMREHPKSFSATLALIIHSLADGVALGASARSSEDGSGVGLVVFAAIFVHKIPASVGLCTTLLSDHLPRSIIRICLALFASAAPLGAFITYALVTQVTKEKNDTVSLTYWTGVLLLISGGTFLYVATVIQDLGHGHSHDSSSNEGQTQVSAGAGNDGYQQNSEEELGSVTALGTIIFGMVTPFILSNMRE